MPDDVSVLGRGAQPPDPPDIRVARRASGRLAAFNIAGVLDLADVHVASRVSALGREPDEVVQLALALAVRALRLGSVCLDLQAVGRSVVGESGETVDVSTLDWPDPAAWSRACAGSPLVSVGPDGEPGRPLRLVNGLLYLDRYWRQEEQVRLELGRRRTAPRPEVDLHRLRAGLRRLFPQGAPHRPRLAAAVSALRWVSVLAGGPGTGKTTTVARLLALLRDQPGSAVRLALAAPTGKAAARLEESVRRETAAMPEPDRARMGELRATTLHRLLGVLPGSGTRFRHHRLNRLPYDVVVVDETSMVSLTLMARLLDAVRPDARVVLVGDPDQLASVEAGAVLGDLVRAPGAIEPDLDTLLSRLVEPADLTGGPVVNGVVLLDRTWRYGGAIADLARAIRAGDEDEVLRLLHAGAAGLDFVPTETLAAREPAGLGGLRSDVISAARALARAAGDGDLVAALRELDRHRLLCGHRRGPFGVSRWSGEIEGWLAAEGLGGPDGERADGLPPDDAGHGGQWYPGRPLLVTANDYELGLFNGDTGVVVRAGGRGGAQVPGAQVPGAQVPGAQVPGAQVPGAQVWAAFARGGAATLVSPARLGAVQTVHAMTVHRGQGSQFERVSVVLPPADSPLLTRELLYTAVTRATTHVRILGSEAAVRAAVQRPIARASGLRGRLMG